MILALVLVLTLIPRESRTGIVVMIGTIAVFTRSVGLLLGLRTLGSGVVIEATITAFIFPIIIFLVLAVFAFEFLAVGVSEAFQGDMTRFLAIRTSLALAIIITAVVLLFPVIQSLVLTSSTHSCDVLCS